VTTPNEIASSISAGQQAMQSTALDSESELTGGQISVAQIEERLTTHGLGAYARNTGAARHRYLENAKLV
jgi:hypothetical protein